MTAKSVQFAPISEKGAGGWKVPCSSAAFDEEGIKSRLLMLEHPCYVVRDGERIGVSNEGSLEAIEVDRLESLAWAPSLPIEQLGDGSFKKAHGASYSYYAGAMATGIASEEMVIALGKEGFLGSFGAAGLVPDRVREAIVRIQQALPQGPYAFNLIHSPHEPALEEASVGLYLEHGVHCVEAAAYLDLTPHVVRYRVAGLALDGQNRVQIKNRVIAKVSRREVATKFMEPAPERILKGLLEQGLITEQQAELSQRVPMADDVTVEADSAGHTDNRPMLALLPSMIVLRDEIQAKQGYEQPVRVGAGGGIGTPEAALATFIMGAAYVVTGSINQACIEAGTSGHAKGLLAKIDMADVTMAPAADMFEMGVQLQVLKRGLLFPMRARKLYDLYRNYGSIEELPPKERKTLEEQIFKGSLESIWESTASFFSERDPSQIEKAGKDPRRKMALIFRWYLGLSSQWAITGERSRKMDYQIWCGPSMGAFNAWVRGTYLEKVDNRKVVDVAWHILTGAAFSWRVRQLWSQGLRLPPACSAYTPAPIRP